jgi:hypothetical protein
MRIYLRRRDIIDQTGLPYRHIDRLLKAEVLKGLRPGGRGRRLYPREEVERVFQIKVAL